MATNKEIGQRIQARRKALKMSQEELAKKVGFKSRSSINKIEVGGRRINPERIEVFAKALDTSVAYIMGLDEEVDIHLKIDDEAKDHIEKLILSYFSQLNDDNKKIAENYLKFLVENQN